MAPNSQHGVASSIQEFQQTEILMQRWLWSADMSWEAKTCAKCSSALENIGDSKFTRVFTCIRPNWHNCFTTEYPKVVQLHVQLQDQLERSLKNHTVALWPAKHVSVYNAGFSHAIHPSVFQRWGRDDVQRTLGLWKFQRSHFLGLCYSVVGWSRLW
jgi:hypothetical protein